MKKFNLSSFNKTAFYNGGKGIVQKQTRHMMNCYKVKLDNGMSAQEAWESCKDEYSQGGNKGEWATKYAKNKSETRDS